MKKALICLLAALLFLSACSQRSDSSRNAGQSDLSETSQSQAAKAETVTKSYRTEQEFEGGKESRILTVTYSGQQYEKVVLRVNRTIPANIKESLGDQDISTVKEELLKVAERLLGLDQIAAIKGIELHTDLTADEILFVLTVHPKELDFEAVKQLPTYGPIFEQIQTLSPEELLSTFKGADGSEVPNPSE
ncbi:hypothetical protein ACVRXQ_08455 [Streptococcus panodentis]|uniref:SP-0191-like C-terminal domain-containing protein n=1 Tax=Streptococcus panodentis TaxID=1581472 RepID=A0ABS5AW10_9STRE|nr:hypothetical protein [Streptococcus panodentis]MBP2620757.1 hypothetical protein [Streptococcus panodentis]